MRRISKKAALGEGILTIYRVLLVSLIAFVILGFSSVFYSHYIDVRDTEAIIMGRNVIECISPDGVLDLDSLKDGDKEKILSYCGFEDLEVDRFFVRIVVEDSFGSEIAELSQGDAGALWIREIFDNKLSKTAETLTYEPGYLELEHKSYILNNKNIISGNLLLEVLVRDEF